ncbi:MAG: hypothetical protein SCH98_05465 [Deferrisomatales bacterium]|nr:hypothetical protein [Deferrisomatales bacterium]
MRQTVVWALLGVAVWSSAAWGLGSRPNGPPAPRSDKDALQLIAEAVQGGEIDADTAVLYRVYAVMDGAKLPSRFHSTVPLRDGTPILREARSRYPDLRPDVREALDPYLFPGGRP